MAFGWTRTCIPTYLHESNVKKPGAPDLKITNVFYMILSMMIVHWLNIIIIRVSNYCNRDSSNLRIIMIVDTYVYEDVARCLKSLSTLLLLNF